MGNFLFSREAPWKNGYGICKQMNEGKDTLRVF